MRKPSRDEFFAEIRGSTARLAEIVDSRDPDVPVPTCPDWNLRQLATHVGRVHRWAAEIVRTRARDRIPFDSAPDGENPAGSADSAAWLIDGADRVIAAITAAADEPVWAFGRLAPASFWARRQAHETSMHRIDAELATGRPVVLEAGLAADGIDEWLEIVTSPRYRERGISQVLPAGAALHLRATAAGESDGGALAEWVVRTSDEGLSMQRGPGRADVSVSGPADQLLLALVRRVPADEAPIDVTGDSALFSGWLAGTPF